MKVKRWKRVSLKGMNQNSSKDASKNLHSKITASGYDLVTLFLQFSFYSQTINIRFTNLPFWWLFELSLSSVIQHCNSVNSYYSISIVIDVLEWRAVCESAPTDGLLSLIGLNEMSKSSWSEMENAASWWDPMQRRLQKTDHWYPMDGKLAISQYETTCIKVTAWWKTLYVGMEFLRICPMVSGSSPFSAKLSLTARRVTSSL